MALGPGSFFPLLFLVSDCLVTSKRGLKAGHRNLVRSVENHSPRTVAAMWLCPRPRCTEQHYSIGGEFFCRLGASGFHSSSITNLDVVGVNLQTTLLNQSLRCPLLKLINQPDLRNTTWKNLPTSRATSFSNYDVAKSGQSQPADDVVESRLTMPVLQAVLEVINQPDLRNTTWKNLPTSRATGFSNYDVAKSGQAEL